MNKDPIEGLHLHISISDARRLGLYLLLLDFALVALYLLNIALGKPFWTINNLLNLDGERSLPAWFSSAQLLVVGLLLGLCARQPPAQRPRAQTLLLCLAAAGFVFLSIDEALSLHERLTHVLKQVSWLPRFRGDHGIWIYVYALLGLLLALPSLKPLLALRARQPGPVGLLLGGFTVLVAGGVGLELISYLFIRGHDLPNLYIAESCLEELLEMVGGTLLLYGALRLLLAEVAPMKR